MGILKAISSAIGIDLESYIRSSIKPKPAKEINIHAIAAAERKRAAKQQKLRKAHARSEAGKVKAQS